MSEKKNKFIAVLGMHRSGSKSGILNFLFISAQKVRSTWLLKICEESSNRFFVWDEAHFFRNRSC
jgi:hypothetical protein